MSVHSPDQMRLDGAIGFLGVPIGVLTINGNRAQFLSYMESRAYTTENGSRVLEKLIKSSVNPKDIISFFSENFRVDSSWSCQLKETEKKCTKDDLLVSLSIASNGKRILILESQKSRVTFKYRKVSSGSTKFKERIPSRYKHIRM